MNFFESRTLTSDKHWQQWLWGRGEQGCLQNRANKTIQEEPFFIETVWHQPPSTVQSSPFCDRDICYQGALVWAPVGTGREIAAPHSTRVCSSEMLYSGSALQWLTDGPVKKLLDVWSCTEGVPTYSVILKVIRAF